MLALVLPSCGEAAEPRAKSPDPHQAGPAHTVNYPKPKDHHKLEIPPLRIEAQPPAPEDTRVAPATFAAFESLEDRCPGHVHRLLLYTDDALELELTAAQAAERLGPVKGLEPPPRHPHFALAALLKGRKAMTVEVWPCEGTPLRLAASDVRAAQRGYVLIATPRRGLKLVDLRAGARTPLVRHIAAIRLLP